MDWAAIVVAVISALVTVFTALQVSEAKRRADRVEQQKVDAEAYRTAQQINRETVATLREDVDRLQREVSTVRQVATKAREDFERQLADAHDAHKAMERYLRGRITKLESALRDSGVPIPNGDML